MAFTAIPVGFLLLSIGFCRTCVLNDLSSTSRVGLYSKVYPGNRGQNLKNTLTQVG